MSDFRFGGMSYATAEQAAGAVAEAYILADGMNGPAEQRHMFQVYSVDQMVEDVFAYWDLIPVDRDQLRAAFEQVRETIKKHGRADPDSYAVKCQEGTDAYDAGKPLAANPYPDGSDDAANWSAGWHDH